jgi:hypothetical protein
MLRIEIMNITSCNISSTLVMNPDHETLTPNAWLAWAFSGSPPDTSRCMPARRMHNKVRGSRALRTRTLPGRIASKAITKYVAIAGSRIVKALEASSGTFFDGSNSMDLTRAPLNQTGTRDYFLSPTKM